MTLTLPQVVAVLVVFALYNAVGWFLTYHIGESRGFQRGKVEGYNVAKRVWMLGGNPENVLPDFPRPMGVHVEPTQED